MDRISYFFIYFFIQLICHLPFRVMYWLSDFCYVLVYYVARYRRSVVKENLRTALPEKSDEERKNIEKEFYHWFCDVLLESVKTFNMTVDDLNEHMKYENMDVFRKHINDGKHVFLDIAHTGSWEWVPNIYLEYFKDIVGAELYRHVKNKYLDKFLFESREKFGTMVILKSKAVRPLAKVNREGKIFALGLLADQTPSRANLHFWIDFLHHDTPFLQGPERMAKMFKASVVYLDFRRVKRGYYICRFEDITADASLEEDGFVTRKYAELLENSIHRDPAIWFWTHRRWKYDHQQVIAEDEKIKQEEILKAKEHSKEEQE